MSFSSDSESEEEPTTCYGCYLLYKGLGGENQLAHMGYGGCLYEELDEETTDDNDKQNLDIYADINKLITHICVVCKITKKIDNEKEDLTSFVCSECKTIKDKEREMRNRSFYFNKYEK